MFDFQKLGVYVKSKKFYRDVKQLIQLHRLDSVTKNQLQRASFSIPLNIAEGSGRYSKADRRNFFVIARASVFETIAILDILNDEEVISIREFEEVEANADELSRILYAMIKNLSK